MSLPILDVQSASSWPCGHVSASVWIPLEELPQRTHELPAKGSGLLVFDPNPKRRAQARAWLISRGYRVQTVEEVPPLVGGSADPAVHLWQPSAFVVRMIDKIAQEQGSNHREGRVLDIGCGSGRESVWLAMRGYQVQAIDILPDALDKAQDLARRQGVKISTQVQDVRRNLCLPAESYQYILMLRFLHRPLAKAITLALQTGGCFIGEVFLPDPNRPSSKYAPCMTPDAWSGLFPGLQEQTSQTHRSPEGQWMTGWVGRKP